MTRACRHLEINLKFPIYPFSHHWRTPNSGKKLPQCPTAIRASRRPQRVNTHAAHPQDREIIATEGSKYSLVLGVMRLALAPSSPAGVFREAVVSGEITIDGRPSAGHSKRCSHPASLPQTGPSKNCSRSSTTYDVRRYLFLKSCDQPPS